MALKEFLRDINDEVRVVVSSDFKIEIIETNIVPRFDDPYITYDNLDTKTKKCKRLESCVLYVDIRDSVRISADRQPQTLAKMYSTFVRSMIAAARYYGGHVRNIIGDRVMVVFDKEQCFTKAVDTAILMNSVAHYIINKHIKGFDFKCGIGIDYGKMLVAKAGAIRRGAETEFYRSLVWLGRPANVASRLTDIANKTIESNPEGVMEGHYYGPLDKWGWYKYTYEQFLDHLQATSSPILRHKSEYFKTFFKTTVGPYTTSYPPILMTEDVYNGYKVENPNAEGVKNGWWSLHSVSIPEYGGKVYGGSVFYSVVNAL